VYGAGDDGDQAGGLPQGRRGSGGTGARDDEVRSVLGRGLCVPGEAGRPCEADLLERHGSVPVRQAARGWQVPLAERAGWGDAAIGCGVLGIAGRARLATGLRRARDPGTGAARLICDRVNQPDRNTRKALRHMV